MPIKKIITIPDPILRQVSEPVKSVDNEIKKLSKDMLETMYEAPGIGLAAVQVGVLKRVIVIDLSKKERVRLAGIDTPESRTRDAEEKVFGLEAKAYLIERLKGSKDLIVKTEKDGKYGRMLGWFYSRQSKDSINNEMVEKGYAWEYDGGKKEKNLQTLTDRRKQ